MPDPRKKVTVCDRCLCASCWQGEFMCNFALGAGTVDLPVETLRELAREGFTDESEDYWKLEGS